MNALTKQQIRNCVVEDDNTLKIGNYPAGYDLTLLNTIYHYPKKDSNGKWTTGSIDLIIKDNVTGEKFLETIMDPKYEYYMLLDDREVPSYNLEYAMKDDCKCIMVPYRELQKDIAYRIGEEDRFWENLRNRNRDANKRLCNYHPAVLMSDMDIEDNIRFQFAHTYLNSYNKGSKSYLDIEADVINCKGDFVELGECPINAISFIDDQSLVIHSFLLRNDKNPLIAEFEESTKSPKLALELKEFLIDAVGGPKNAEKYRVNQMTVQFHFYDEKDEVKMLIHLFNYINNLKPDFVLAWNMAFDIPYIIQRLINLGIDPKDVMCSPDFRFKEVKYFIDERNEFNYEERNDYAKISSYSVYTDQMIHFASRRKGGAALPSYRLDDIGQMTCGVRKLDYSHITNNLAELPYKDYKTFVFYNIMDTIVQYCIEYKCADIDSAYNNVLLNNTRWSKIYRQTVYLKNRQAIFNYKNGFISGNNVNANTPKVKFPGAFVANPKLNSDYSKMVLNGRPVSIFDNLDDFDYKALYPSITSEFNASRTTLIGHVNIPTKVYEFENRFNRDEIKWKREAQYMDDLQSHNWIEFFHRWFHFGSYEDVYDDIIEYFTKVKYPMGILTYHDFDDVSGIPEEDNRSVFVKCETERDWLIVDAIARKDLSYMNQPRFDFEKSDFNNFTDIFNSLKDGYTYSKPKQVGVE
jgi:DNA polymerase elongation subunit (family B)